ncbi:MAG: hypothetical protein Q4D14_02245 [Bacteroidales bacterium]|nr:hypothetical protein [Bacteroidales bacterium]
MINKKQLKDCRREFVLFLAFPFFLVILFLLQVYPNRWRPKTARSIGRLAFRWGKHSRNITINNLQLGYGHEKTPEEIVAMAREVFEETAVSVTDFFATVFIRSKEKFFKLVEVEGLEHLQQAYNRGKGVICLIPHQSIWELSAVTPPMLGFATHAVSKPIKGMLFQKMMVRFRAKRGMYNYERDHSYQKIIDSMHQGECMIMMIDQDTMVKGTFVDFFGRQAYTPLGCARIVADTGCAVVPMTTIRMSDTHYKFKINPELPFIRTGHIDNDLVVNTQHETLAMENFIRAYPTQWVWMHRRWKTTPEKLAQFLERKRKEKEQATAK